MFRINLPADRTMIDMPAVARAFGISVGGLGACMHTGTISRWFEVGEADADNKPHPTFDSAKLGIRVEVDEHVAVLFATPLKSRAGGVSGRS